MKVSEWDWSMRAYNVLNCYAYDVWELPFEDLAARYTYEDLLKWRQCGRITAAEIERACLANKVVLRKRDDEFFELDPNVLESALSYVRKRKRDWRWWQNKAETLGEEVIAFLMGYGKGLTDGAQLAAPIKSEEGEGARNE